MSSTSSLVGGITELPKYCFQNQYKYFQYNIISKETFSALKPHLESPVNPEVWSPGSSIQMFEFLQDVGTGIKMRSYSMGQKFSIKTGIEAIFPCPERVSQKLCFEINLTQ